MKKILLIILLLVSKNIYSQSFEGLLVLGFAASQIDGDSYGGYHKIGGHFGIDVRYPFSDNVKLQSGVEYINKGAANAKNQDYYRVHLHYIQVPLLLEVVVYHNISLTAGLNFDYLIRGNSPSHYGDLKLRNFAPCTYGSINYYISEKLMLNMGNSYSFINVKKYGDLWWNNTLNISFTRRL